MTDTEKLLIMFMTDFMETAGRYDSDQARTIRSMALEGNEIDILDFYKKTINAAEPHNYEINEVRSILRMWTAIEESIDQLEGEEANVSKSWFPQCFFGFDAEDDLHLELSARLIDEHGEFANFSDRTRISGSKGTLPFYRKILSKFSRVAAGAHGGMLSFKELELLLGEPDQFDYLLDSNGKKPAASASVDDRNFQS